MDSFEQVSRRLKSWIVATGGNFKMYRPGIDKDKAIEKVQVSAIDVVDTFLRVNSKDPEDDLGHRDRLIAFAQADSLCRQGTFEMNAEKWREAQAK
jgi:hypothetical protein